MDDTAGRGPVRWRRTLVLLLGLPGLLLSVLLLLVVVGILLRDRIVNSAPIRKEISFALYQFTGRDITLQGEIEIEDFPWVTVVVGPGSFGNPPDFTGLLCCRGDKFACVCTTARSTNGRRCSIASPSRAWWRICAAIATVATTSATSVPSSQAVRPKQRSPCPSSNFATRVSATPMKHGRPSR